MPPIRDLAGQRFGRLVVQSRAGRNRHRQTLWLCRCDCGQTTTVSTSDLTGGKVQSCGCIRSEQVAARNRQQVPRVCRICQRQFLGAAHAVICSPECQRVADCRRSARPRVPCDCAWCGAVIAAPVTNQKFCSAECAWESTLADERASRPAKRARLTQEQREARREYLRAWKARQAVQALADEAAELEQRLNERLTDDDGIDPAT